MKEIIVGTTNEGKLEAVRQAFSRIASLDLYTDDFTVSGVAVNSGVSDQPMSDHEMIRGARMRAIQALSKHQDADLSIGLEGGLKDTPMGWYDLGWVCVIDPVGPKSGYGVTAGIRVPGNVMELITGEEQLELSDAVEAVYGTDTINNRDCSGVITHGLIPVDELYASAVMSAYADLQNRT